MPFDQGQFDFNAGDESGWRRWREELETAQRVFEAKWGVVLGKTVEIRLTCHVKPLQGRLEWIRPGSGSPPSGPPRFRIKGLEFGHDEIESIVQIA